MSRLIPLVTAILLSTVMCSIANADPDRSLVRIVISGDSSVVTVSGSTRVKVVQAVMQSLKETNRPCATVSVGPWLQLPAIQPQHSSMPSFTIYIDDRICIDDRMEDSKLTAYIATSADVPFDVVCQVSAGLSTVGYDDVRLISEETLLEILIESK